MPRKQERIEQQRILIAQRAASLIAENGIRDYHLAKRKAAEQLGFNANSGLPKNQEIEDALRSYQNLFDQNSDQRQQELRRMALECMTLLEEFRPLLTGRVASGTATEHTPITLHCFSDNPRLVATKLMDEYIEFEAAEKRLSLNAEIQNDYPCFVFLFEDVKVEALVLPYQFERQAPLAKHNGKPMLRMNKNQLQSLVDFL